MPKTIQQNTDIEISSVEEKIKVEKRLPFDPNNKKGPTTNLYFHELPSNQTTGQELLQFFVGLLFGVFFLTTLPVFALYIKVISGGPVFIKQKHTGQRGRVFNLITYNVTKNKSGEPYFGAVFLKKSGLYKLPAILNLWKGNLNLVGPCSYPEKWCNKWNTEFSDFYKRFALNPGLLSITPSVKDPNEIDKVADMLEREISYIVNPTLTKDIKRIFGQYQ